eukprot:1166263-Rhodomonas_salina.2
MSKRRKFDLPSPPMTLDPIIAPPPLDPRPTSASPPSIDLQPYLPSHSQLWTLPPLPCTTINSSSPLSLEPRPYLPSLSRPLTRPPLTGSTPPPAC